MRRSALFLGILCLALSLFSAKPAQAGWFGLNVGAGCTTTTGGLAARCPSVAAACESFAIFRNSSGPQVVGVNPVYSQGKLEGYNCSTVFFCCQLIANDFTEPSCDATEVPDPLAASGCSNVGAPNPAQFGQCCQSDGGPQNGGPKNGAGDMVGNPVNIAIGNKFEEVTDYRSQGSDTLAFTRYYNGLSSLTSALGIGWRSNFDRQIIGLNGTLAPGQTLLLLRQDGAVYQFDPLSGGGYVSHEP
ncbi:MAG TPA: DUF6531 domain-containing protein, partial [Stellaceae bacterium]|nr:DUF6531 domain-containing protein [Stellaceae bacterium]